jgi:hypothetical protein
MLYWTTCNKSVELKNLVASCGKAGNKQCEHILMTSCWNSIATSLLHFVTTCALLHVSCTFLFEHPAKTSLPFKRDKVLKTYHGHAKTQKKRWVILNLQYITHVYSIARKIQKVNATSHTRKEFRSYLWVLAHTRARRLLHFINPFGALPCLSSASYL